MWQFLSILALLFSFPLFGETVCLNMIVKNEAPVIRRCLESVKPLIQHWVIVDTGSTDGTQQIIRECLKDIPGELYERPWKDFAHNRNEALDLAKTKGDYLLFIDADEEFAFAPSFSIPSLEEDRYWSVVHEVTNRVDYLRVFLIKAALPWRWIGVLHETIDCPDAAPGLLMQGIQNLSRTEEGARGRDPRKYLKDAAVLEEALKTEPENSRYYFYLGQSYLNAREFEKSLKNYEKRSTMGGLDEEVFLSLYLCAHLQEQLHMSPDIFLQSYWKAYHFRPFRAEPLFRLASYYEQANAPLLGYLLSKHALSFPYPNETLFVENWIYEWGLLTKVGECAAMLGHRDEAMEALQKVLAHKDVPDDVRKVEESNLKFLLSQ